MSNLPNTKRFQIYVGFGGAGCRSITAMTSLIRDDFKLGRGIDKQLCIILADTDVNDLNSSVAQIKNNLADFYNARSSSLMIETLELGSPWARGLDFPTSILEKFYSIKKNHGDDGLNKYQDNWWMKRGGNPFCFNGVQDPTQGASQMPLSSRIMAWWNADKIRDLVDGMVSEAIKRNGGETNCGGCDIYFVNSLAGGTGRGTWSTLAFMLRDAFLSRGIKASPMGIFLDATTFPDMKPLEQPRLKLNSLTGISEVMMWLRNARNESAGKRRYVLLHPDNPDMKLAVIDTFKRIPGMSENSEASQAHIDTYTGDPVDMACFIFGENQNSFSFKDKKDYQNQAGQILFSLIKYSDFRTKELNNTAGAYPVFSLGSSNFGVKIDAVKDYINELAKLTMMERGFTGTTNEPDAPKSPEDKFVALLGLSLKDQSKLETSFNWDVWPKLAAKVDTFGSMKFSTMSLSRLISSKEKQVPDEWLDAAKQIDTFDFNREDFLRREMGSYFTASFNLEPVKDGKSMSSGHILARAMVECLFGSAYHTKRIKAGIVSAADKLAVLKCAQEYYSSLAVFLDDVQNKKVWGDGRLAGKYPQTVSNLIPSGDSSSIQKLVDSLKSAPWWPIGSNEHFDVKEKKTIQAAGEQRLRDNAAKVFTSTFKSACIEAAAEWQEIIDTLQPLLEIIKNEVAQLRRSLDESEKDNKKVQSFLITKPSDFESCRLLNVADQHDPRRRFSMEIKSPWTAEVEKDVINQIDLLFAGNNDTHSVARQAVDRVHDLFHESALKDLAVAGSLKDTNSSDYAKCLSEVRSCLGILSGSIEIPTDFLERHFSLGAVLRRYVEIAKKNSLHLTGQAKQSLLDEYSTVLGIDLSKVTIAEMRNSDLVLGLAKYGANFTSPWAKIVAQPGMRDTRKSYLYIARCADRENKELEDLGSQIGTNMQCSVHDSPFGISILSYVAFPGWKHEDQNLGGVVSLDYWRTSGNEVMQMLKSAEMRSPIENNLALGGCRLDALAELGGIGYLDPRFVTDENWRSVRWRPWAPTEVAPAQILHRVFAYLTLFGNFATTTDTDSRTSISGLQARLSEEKGWVLPLLVRDDEGSWSWSRRLYLSDTKAAKGFRESNQKGQEWKTAPTPTRHKSINEVYKFILGLSLETLKLLDWEITQLGLHLSDLEMNTSQREHLRQNAQEFYDQLSVETDKWSKINHDTKVSLDEFYNVSLLLSGFDAVLPSKR